MSQNTPLNRNLFVSIQSSDEDLMQAYVAGNEEAFKLLFSRYSGKLMGFLMNHLKNQSLSEEIFQRTFLKLHESREKYKKGLPFPPWLFTLCRNTMIDVLRKTKKENSILERFAMEVTEMESTQEENNSIETSLNILPEIQKNAIQLRYEQDLSFDEIGKRLGTSTQNARQLISRAIRKLRGTS